MCGSKTLLERLSWDGTEKGTGYQKNKERGEKQSGGKSKGKSKLEGGEGEKGDVDSELIK